MQSGSRLARYFLAVLSTASALVARLLMDPVLEIRIPYATFYVAVAVSAVGGGLGPAIVSALLGGFAALYFLVPPRHVPFRIEGADNRLGFALYLCVVAMLITLAEMQRRAKLRAEAESAARERAQAEERLQRQQYESILSGIGDGVIATDSEGRTTFINPVAAKLTGWQASDALGQALENVFVIREETGAEVENPALRAMREGLVTGLANHTVLLSKSG